MTGLQHAWGGDEKSNHADFRHNGVPPDDFEDDLVPHKKKRGSKRPPKKKRGCPENDFGPHIYVWEASKVVYDWWPDYVDNFYDQHGFHRREYKTCCGCGKTNGSRYTEEMQKLINKKGWYQANYGD